MKFVPTLALAAAAFALVGTASAQSFGKPEDAIKYRQGAFRVLGAHFGALGAMAQGKAPYDAAAASRHADVIALVSHLPFAGFGPGTDKGAETRALPEVWTEQAKFKDLAEKMQDAVGKLAVAAKTGSVENLKTAFGPAGNSCKACHDDFRKK